MPDFVFDPERTRDRIRALEQYYSKHVLRNGNFLCHKEEECRHSAEQRGAGFYEGQLPYVGAHYDLELGGKALRVVVSGYESGGDERFQTMQKRVGDILGSAMDKRHVADQGQENARNPHMKGTSVLLKSLFFGTPDDREWKREFVRGGEHFDDHIFSMFALVNYLHCSALASSQGRASSLPRRGMRTPVMLANCFTHYMEALKILQPTVVIFQGKDLFASFKRQVAKESGGTLLSPGGGPKLHTFEGCGLNFLVCDFLHPSSPAAGHGYNRGKRGYLEKIVLPALNKVRAELGITSP